MSRAELLAWALCTLGLWIVWRSWRRGKVIRELAGRKRCAGRWSWKDQHAKTAGGRKPADGWWVYRMRDSKGRVRYVGRTDELHERFMAHGKTFRCADWKTWEAYRCSSERDAQQLELALWKQHQGPWLDNKIAPSQSRD